MDPRQQRQAYQPRPAYPQAVQETASSSTPSSVFQSSSSLASLSSISTASAAQMPSSSAPLPSPSMQQPANYFNPTSHPSHAQQQRIPAAQQQHQPVASPYIGQRGDGSGMPETTPFLQDFSLVAEAAKRAQMACLSRDLGDVGL